jgi:hypothetical protein
LVRFNYLRAIALTGVFFTPVNANNEFSCGLYFGAGMHLGLENTCSISSTGSPFFDDANSNGKQDPGEKSIELSGSEDFASNNFGNGGAVSIGIFIDPMGSNFFNMTPAGLKTELLFRYIPSPTNPVFMADWRLGVSFLYVLEGYVSLGGHYPRHLTPSYEMIYTGKTLYGPKTPTFKAGPTPFTMSMGGGIVLPLFKHLQIAGQIGGFMTGGDAYWHGGEIVVTLRYFLDLAEEPTQKHKYKPPYHEAKEPGK